MYEKKFTAMFLAIVVLFCLFRLPALNQDVFGDEFYYYYYSYHDVDSHPEVGDYNYVYFIPIIFYKAGYFLTGDIAGLRLVSLFFGLANLVLAMLFIRRFYSEKAGIIFGFLYSIIPWTVFSSILLDNDATIISLLFVALLWITGIMGERRKGYSFIKTDSRKPHLLFMSGIAIGAMFFLKFVTTIPIIFALFLSINIAEIKKRDFSSIVRNSMPVAAGFASIILLMAAFYSFVFGPEVMGLLFSHYLGQSVGTVSGMGAAFFIQLMIPVLFFSPFALLVIPTVMKIFMDNKNGIVLSEKSYSEIFMVLSIIFLSAFLVLSTYIHNYITLNRYLTIILVPVIILLSVFIVNLFERSPVSGNFSKKYFLSLSAGTACMAAILFIFHLLPHRLINFYPKTDFIISILNLNWNILVPFNGSNGPIGFYVSLIPIAISFGAALIISILILFSKKESSRALLISLLVAFSASYCIYISTQFAFTPFGPVISDVNRDMRLDASGDFDYYVSRNKPGFFSQNNGNFTYIKSLDFSDENNQTKIKEIISSGKKIYILDFPQMNKNSSLWISLESSCKMEKTYYSREWAIGYMFQC